MIGAIQGFPLILGGHSFIEQLGNDQAADPQLQIEIVTACLDAGITRFDTTYQPERVALGGALAALGRRDEATIIAWNFFVDFGPGDKLVGPDEYQPHHIEMMCEQLQTDFIDCLVVHQVDDPAVDARQNEQAATWFADGKVGRLGIWGLSEDPEAQFGDGNPFSFMVCPYNVTNGPHVPGLFAACKRLGWENFACTPYVRGWRLDELIEKAAAIESLTPEQLRPKLADHMLRYSVFGDNVDWLIVAMRKPQYVAANIESYHRGPLTDDEHNWLMNLVTGSQ